MVVTMTHVDTESLKLLVESGDMVVRLFTNDHEPGRTDVASDYEQPNFPGYEPALLDRLAWTYKFGIATHPDVNFYCTGFAANEKIRGYYLTRPGDLKPRFAERFDVPEEDVPVMKDANDEITITPKIPGAKDEE